MATGEYKFRFVGDTNPHRTKHFHSVLNQKQTCGLIALESRGNKIEFATMEMARNAGYAPCTFCLPHEKDRS
jgi:hypothetical protein